MAEIIVTDHAKYRLLERGVDVRETKKIANNGKVTKIESDGTITRMGMCDNGLPLTVISKKEGNRIIIKTANYEH